MRRVTRQALPASAQHYLDRRQANADDLHSAHRLDIDKHWKNSRQTRALLKVLETLQTMAGPRQRCMYCLDSHGSDIEHFRPKALWPQRMYQWPNLLLCCTFCGRLKGSQFPRQGRRALLLDPTRENPWDHLDFDPQTGNLCARFDLTSGDWSAKGAETVRVLQLDRRESLSRGYLKTLHRLSAVVDAAPTEPVIQADTLLARLRAEDDHGLLGWCFTARGATLTPFSDLSQRHSTIWRQCQRVLAL
jgi:uncharacterized protein (TIGR02646 family)